MGLAVRMQAAQFNVHIRCISCLREKVRIVDVPEGCDPPGHLSELEELGYMNGEKFHCSHCDSMIGRVVAISGGD